MPYTNPVIGSTYRGTTDELISQIVTALGGGGGGAATKAEVSGGLADLSGASATYTDKRAIYPIWQPTGGGSVIIDGMTFNYPDILPEFPDVGGGFKHRSITIDGTGATGLHVHYLDA